MPETKKRSPGRPRKSTVGKIEKTLEKPTESVLMGFEGVAFLFLLGAVAAVIAWMVYVAKFNIDLYNNTTGGNQNLDQQINAGNITLKNLLTIEQYTICYQAVVASLLLYFAFKHHFAE